ncbi:MAG: trehalose-6-phosphate [Bacteroidetes bacterium]|nr:MAG: trehalose-6-phosphate [Bacteroidota bacterium]
MNRIILCCLFLFYFMTGFTQTDHEPVPAVWWKETVFYQIYMPSFQDSDGNGISDFAGMTSRLDYLQSLGIKGIWLTPFLKSPKVDNGYDVADYYKIDSVYGNLADFRNFLDEAHRRGIKVIIDMVVNHTSTDSRWFQESRKSRDNPYRDYYIWRDQPNNWESFFGGKAWEYDSVTDQYYYHKFDVRMADLNWSNPRVVEEIQNVLRYWLELGVDGFRMDVINFLTTDGILSDNPMKDGNQQHIYDIDQPGVKEAMRIIKATIDEYDNRFVVGEIGSDKLKVLRQYQSPEMMDVVFNFNFGSIPEFSLDRIFKELQQMESSLSDYPTLFFGSHDMPRLMDRLAGGNPERAKSLAALILTARGVPFIYYGEEIGMQNIYAETFDEIVDIQGKTHYKLALDSGKTPEEALAEGNRHNRDKSRSPMQWNDEVNAGFSSGRPWIKVHPDYMKVNLQQSLRQENSILNTYKSLISLRNKEKTLQYGTYGKLEQSGDQIRFTRTFQNEKITVIINFGEGLNIDLPQGAEVLMGQPYLNINEFLIYRH